MTEEFIRERLTQLRIKANISEYKMSLDLGHSKSYIQSISSGKSLPSMAEFLFICEYLNITPAQFFSQDNANPAKINEINSILEKLPDDDIDTVLHLVKRLSK